MLRKLHKAQTDAKEGDAICWVALQRNHANWQDDSDLCSKQLTVMITSH